LAVLRYAAALFDLDGTLIDSGEDLVASVRYALAAVFPGREPPDAEDILVQVGKPLEVIMRELRYPDDDANARRFVDVYRAHYAEHFNDHTKPYPGVVELLEGLRAAGAKLALVTTKHQAQADFTARECGLLAWLDHVHGWREDRKHKPDPEPVRLALEALGGAPGQALMVGDSELDIEAGRAAGVATCAVGWGFRPAWLLKEYCPDFLVGAARDIGDIVLGPR